MDRKNALELFEKLRACEEVVGWFEESGLSPKQAWRQCQRGDWMLWLAAKMDVDRKRVVLVACECARLSLKFVSKGEDRPLKAIETAEKWAKGESGITLEQVRTAADAAAYAAYAADAAADAADAAAYAAYAAAYAADATYAAAYAAYAATSAARFSTLKKCATIVRRHIKFSDVFPDGKAGGCNQKN